MSQEYPIWLVAKHISAVSPCFQRVGASNLWRADRVCMLCRLAIDPSRMKGAWHHILDISEWARQIGSSQRRVIKAACLRSRGSASGLLPQRTSRVMPLMSTYNARLVCRDFGLRRWPI